MTEKKGLKLVRTGITDAVSVVYQRQATTEPGCGSHVQSGRWYCIQTLQQMEALAIVELDAQGYRVHFPRFLDYSQKDPVPRFLFPGYGFVYFSLRDDRWRPICHTKGVRRLFGASPELPTPVRVGEVERLIARGRSGDGLIDEREEPEDLTGAAVRLTEGPFAGHHGICSLSDRDRITVMLLMLGQERPIEAKRSEVERV